MSRGLATMVALAVAIVGCAVPRASTSPALPTAAPLLDPSMLVAKWTSVGDRAFPKMPADAFADLTIDATTLSMNGWKGPIDSSWSLTAPDRHLVVTMRATQANLTMQHFDCRPGHEGSYTVGLSSDRRTMTLTPMHDDCPARSAILTGGWTRWPCPNPDSVCAPELEPGLHHSSFAQYGDPYSPASSPPALSGYSYIVPAGWSSLENSLARPNDPGTMAIRLALDVAPHSQAANCPDAVEPGVGSSPADLATWLQGLPGLVTTTPTPVTIGSLGVAAALPAVPRGRSGARRLPLQGPRRSPGGRRPLEVHPAGVRCGAYPAHRDQRPRRSLVERPRPGCHADRRDLPVHPMTRRDYRTPRSWGRPPTAETMSRASITWASVVLGLRKAKRIKA